MLIRILELPKQFPTGFHFGGPAPVTFLEHDWFRDDPETGSPDFSTADGRASVEKFIRGKKYFHEDRVYLVLHPKYPFTIGYEAP